MEPLAKHRRVHRLAVDGLFKVCTCVRLIAPSGAPDMRATTLRDRAVELGGYDVSDAGVVRLVN